MTIIILIIVLAVVIWSVSTLNRMNRLKVKVNEARSGIDIALAKRYDILTESLNVAKGYASHEKELMISLSQVRSGMPLHEVQQVIDNQNEAIEKIKMVGESYPELYSNKLFMTLQNQVEETNEHLSASKRLYNSNISLYNQTIVQFPQSIIAGVSGNHEMEFLKEENAIKKQDVHMEF